MNLEGQIFDRYFWPPLYLSRKKFIITNTKNLTHRSQEITGENTTDPKGPRVGSAPL